MRSPIYRTQTERAKSVARMHSSLSSTSREWDSWEREYINTKFHWRNPMTKNAKDIIVASLVLGGIAMGIWAATWGIVGHQRGIYGGYSYGDARYHAAQALANRYGYDVLGGMTMGKPDVLKVHSRDTILNPRSQMRVFHLIGRKGVHYCVSVHEGHNARPLTFVTKGCKF